MIGCFIKNVFEKIRTREVKKLENKLKEKGKESSSNTIAFQHKIEELERKLRQEQEQVTESLLLCKKIDELEEKLRKQEQQLELQSQQEQQLTLQLQEQQLKLQQVQEQILQLQTQAQDQQMPCTTDSANAVRLNTPQEAKKLERDERMTEADHTTS